MSPFLFDIFVDVVVVTKVQSVNMGCCVTHVCTSIILYADDILLLAFSISGLEKSLSLCEEKLYFLDLRINNKKNRSVYVLVAGMVFVVHSLGAVRWVNTCRYGYLSCQ